MAVATQSEAALASVPATHRPAAWFSRVVLLGALSIIVGVLWDISWHRTIGRDTFWTPAHMAIYLGGLLGGLTGGWLVLRASFLGAKEDRAAGVRVWGLRGPLGAWVCIWGALAMLTSAPFDDWWHSAYGLDVKILSPPHTVLALGMWAIVWGALLLVLREQNNAPPAEARKDQRFLLFASGVLVAMAAVFVIEESFPNQQRSQMFYRISSMTYPLYLVGLARASRARWGATVIALVYMVITAGMAWVLPLFPGEPMLGPIYHRVDHFVPLPFPLLLIVPALAIDLLRRWVGEGRGWWRDWALALLAAIAFTGLFIAVQWYFSAFLLSPAGGNWFFAGDRHWGYTEGPGPWRNEFWSATNPGRNPALTLKGAGVNLLFAFASARVGLWLGNWMAKVRR